MDKRIYQSESSSQDHPASVSVLIQTDLEGAEQVVRGGMYAMVITGDEHEADASFYGTTNEICAIGIFNALEELKKRLMEQHPAAALLHLLNAAKDTSEDCQKRLGDILAEAIGGGDIDGE